MPVTHSTGLSDVASTNVGGASVDVHLTVRNGIALRNACQLGAEEARGGLSYTRPCARKPVRKSLCLLHEDRVLLVGQLVCAEHTTDVANGALEYAMEHEPSGRTRNGRAID